MTDPSIPYPALTKRYITLHRRSSVKRLRAAEETTAEEVAEEFVQSVHAFERFQVDDPFFPEIAGRDDGKRKESERRTYGWAMAMKRTPVIKVDGDAELDFRYVEREIVPTRTEHRREFEAPVDDDQERKGHHLQVDLILANARSGRPIIAELKIASDKEPYTALIQALAAAAQLTPHNQRQRLAQLPRAPAGPATEPVIDVYVLLAGFPPDGLHRFEQLACARTLAGQLESHVTLKGYLGRVRILQVFGRDTECVTATAELPSRR